MRTLLLSLPVLLLLGACGDKEDGDDTSAAGCDACGSDDACVMYLSDDGSDDSQECATLPAECDGVGCEDTTCVGALYGLCDEGWIGVGCSEDGSGSPIVSCNPDTVSR